MVDKPARRLTVSEYLIEFPHTTDNCMQMQMLAGLDMDYPELLPMISWGCMADNHGGWAMVDAESDAEALDMLPITMRDKVRVTKLNKFTAGEIREWHGKAA